MFEFNRISVIGLGYVGLPTAAVIANRGITVIGVDTNESNVEMINAGKVPLVEPDLDILVRSAIATGNLKATTTPEPADAFVIAVPTPFTVAYKPDLSYLEAAATALAPTLEAGNLVILESTSPVGATEKLEAWLATGRPDLKFPSQHGEAADIQIAHSPERVLPGRVLVELVQNDRVIGGLTKKCSQRAADFYGLFVNGNCRLTSARTAELVKLAENAYRDANIAFANEMSLVCDHLDINVWEMIELANRHPRVQILQPGPGVGGHCIAVDPWFIADSAPEITPLIQTARQVNDNKPNWVVDRAYEVAVQSDCWAIACLGLAYKADIDDLRESPALKITRDLADRFEGKILVVEPNIDVLPDELYGAGNIELTKLDDAIESAGLAVMLTDHKEFRTLDRAALDSIEIIDTRGMWR